jgi:hypothetical protein
MDRRPPVTSAIKKKSILFVNDAGKSVLFIGILGTLSLLSFKNGVHIRIGTRAQYHVNNACLFNYLANLHLLITKDNNFKRQLKTP